MRWGFGAGRPGGDKRSAPRGSEQGRVLGCPPRATPEGTDTRSPQQSRSLGPCMQHPSPGLSGWPGPRTPLPPQDFHGCRDLGPAETRHCCGETPETGARHCPWWKSSSKPSVRGAGCFSSAVRPANRCNVPRALNKIGPRRSPRARPCARVTSAPCPTSLLGRRLRGWVRDGLGGPGRQREGKGLRHQAGAASSCARAGTPRPPPQVLPAAPLPTAHSDACPRAPTACPRACTARPLRTHVRALRARQRLGWESERALVRGAAACRGRRVGWRPRR